MAPRLASARLTAQLQNEVENMFYGDTATISQYTQTGIDSNRQPTGTTATTSVSGSFSYISSSSTDLREKWTNQFDITKLVAEFRYNSSPVPKKGDTVAITGRYDESAYVDKTFEVVGIINRGRFGYLLGLKVSEL